MNRPSVLVVEDRPSVLRLMATILEHAYQVTTAADGATALALLGSEAFDVVLTDVRLSGATGFEVLRGVQRLSARTKVVMMTAYANVPDAVAAMRQGAFDYVAKPLDADEIALVVARAADSARSSEATPPVAANDADERGQAAGAPGAEVSQGFHRAIEAARDRASRVYLTELLSVSGGNVTRAACRAGMTRESLHRVLRKYGIRAADSRRSEAGGAGAMSAGAASSATGPEQSASRRS